MSNSGLECVGSCLQRCSEYQRGEMRQRTPPRAAADVPHGEGSGHSCTGTEAARAFNPHPEPARADPEPSSSPDGERLRAGSGPNPTPCPALPFAESPWQPQQEPGSFQMGEMLLVAQFPSRLGRQDTFPVLLQG